MLLRLLFFTYKHTKLFVRETPKSALVSSFSHKLLQDRNEKFNLATSAQINSKPNMQIFVKTVSIYNMSSL